MKLKLKATIACALEPQEAEDLALVMDTLVTLPLPADIRWNVTRLENLLCQKPRSDELDEP